MNRIRQRAVAVAAAIAIVGSVGVVAWQAAGVDANPGQGQTLGLYGQLTDLGGVQNPSSPGDMTLIGRDLYQLTEAGGVPAPEGDRIGRLVGMCTLITTSEGVCHGVIDLDGRGTIALYLEVGPGAGNAGLAVTGGTGEFAGANGTADELPVAGHPQDHYFHISLNGYSAP